MSDNRKNKVLLLRPNNTGLFILLFFVIVSILAVNSERAPVIDRQNVRFLFDVSSPYAGDKGYYQPTDVLVINDGRHILADTSNHRVLVLEPATLPNYDVVKIIGSVGGGPGQFNYPYAIVKGEYDGENAIYVADTYNSRIQIFSIDDPSYPYLAEFSVLEGETNSILFSMYIDGDFLYVVDSHPNHPRVLVYDLSSTPTIVLDASKTFTLTGFDEKLVDGVIVGPDGDVYILDEFQVVRFRAGAPYQNINIPSGTQLYFPQGLSFGANTNTMLVSDTLNNRVVIFTYDGSVWTYADTFGSEGVSDGEFQEPKNVHYYNDGTNSYYYVVDTGNNRVQWFQPTSPYNYVGSLARDAVAADQLDKPAGVAFDHATGLLYVSNTQNNRIDVFDPQDQSHQASFGSFGIHSGSSNLDEFRNGPFGMNFGQDGMLYVADTNNNRLISFTTQAATSPFIEVDANSEAYIAGASNIAVPKGGVQCGTGANAYVFVASTGSSQIAKYDVDGAWVETYPTVEPAEPWNEGGDGQFYYPTEIVCGIEADEIVVVDQGNNRLQVLKFDWTHVENIGLSGGTPGSLGELMSPVSVSIKDERYWVLETIGRVTVFDTDGTALFRFGDDTVFNTPQSISATDAYVFIADTGNNIVHAYCGGLPVPTYEPAPELYQGIAVDLGLAITAGGVVGSVAGYTLVIDIVGPSGNSVPGLTVEAYQTTYPEDTLRIYGVPSAAGTYNVTALFEDDNACSSPTLTFSLVVQDALPFRVDSYSPVAQIPTSGNQNVTLRGLFDWTTTHLVYPGFTLEVFIGGESCTDVHVDGLFIYCNAPEGAGYHNEIEARLSHASLLTPLSSIAPVEFSYKPPNITQIIPFPSTGLPIRGGLVTIVGDSLGKVGTLDRIKVKGLSCTSITAVVGQEHYQLTCVLPYGAGNLNSLFLEVGSDTLGWLNTTTPVFFERPETSCTTPGLVVEAISTSGGGELNICGSNFGMYELGQSFGVTAWEGRREVYIKNRPCTITFINDTLIQCTLPPGAGAFNKVWVNINSDINSWVLVDINVRYPPPILTHIVPSRQLVPGMLITVYGKNFGFWVPEAKKTATIGDNNDCSHVDVLSDGQLTCIVTRGSGDNQPVVVTVADQRSSPILTVDYKDHYTPGLPCEAPLGAQDPWFTDREVCNCFSGYAPSDHTQTDCNVRAVCPGHEISSGVASQFAPQRPTVTFSNDRLILSQIAPIVKDRRDVHIRFEVPHNTLGIPAGTPGAETCGYPGEIWTKTVDSLDCNDLYHLSMPWTQQGMCGFVQDSNPASTTVEFKAELVTEWRDIIMERGQLHQKLRSVAYLVTVKFIRELKITTGSVSVMVADPTRSPIDVTLTSALLFDPAISNIVFTFVTTLEWPYQIDTTGPMYAKYVPKYGVGEVTIYAIASSPQPGNLQCDETSSTLCEQEWQAVMIPGADVCTIQGSMVFNTTQMLCRDLDSMACPNAIDYETAFTMFTSAIRVCDDEVLDATAETSAALTTFMDREFYTPSNMYSIGDTAFFKVDIVDQRVSIDAIYVSQVDIWEGTVSQPLYPATDSFLKSIGFNFTNVVTTGDAPIAPGTPAQVVVWFDLSRSYINALAAIQADGLASLVVEITLDVSYHGNNKKREITAQLEIPTGSVSAAAQLSVLGVEENYLADASGAAMAVEDGETFEFFRSSASGLHPSSATITIVAGGLAALLILL